MSQRLLTLDDFTITRDGEIYNKTTNRKKHPTQNAKGYLIVNIGGKSFRVHRLVAKLYVPNPENKPQVNHKDGNKLNNSADNLEWVSNQENRDHAVRNGLHVSGERCPWAKLTKDDVDYIRSNTDISCSEFARQYHMSPSHISAIRNMHCWK